MRVSVVNRFAKSTTAARARRLALAVPLAAVVAVGLSACADPKHGSAAQPAPADTATASAAGPAATASATPTADPSASPTLLNGTADNGLTISNGTRFVVMNGTTVDFGTPVHDLAWSPDGKKAAFVDGSGNLVVAAPDGSGQVTVAKNPGGQTWSHPAWQVAAADQNTPEARNNLFFTAEQSNVLRLMGVPATAAGGTPKPLSLGTESGDNVTSLPQTGNQWPNTGGKVGRAVYANRNTGEVYVRDEYLRQTGYSLAKGSEPTLSPDGNDVVFVRSVDGHSHLFAQHANEKAAKDLTPGATADYTEPVYSADGKTLAARTEQGIVTLPANGSAAPTLVSGYTGLPAFRPGK
ncbi:hypothetical protein [Kitasatospora cinereorecta]|uniref:WD40 repeat protein n=1 Tax=Kitasatospora cinereorecta TaxID=285560 RepID=A0ABW0VB31_9ACTN